MSEEVPIFGTRELGKMYARRPGSYAVIWNGKGEIAVMDTPQGHFLPGGGADIGEMPESTLVRELQEELGATVKFGRKIGESIQLVFAPGEGCFEKEGTFFDVEILSIGSVASEPDHKLTWISPEDAMRALTQEFQVWAVRQAVKQRT